jgi:hypothetical protein
MSGVLQPHAGRRRAGAKIAPRTCTKTAQEPRESAYVSRERVWRTLPGPSSASAGWARSRTYQPPAIYKRSYIIDQHVTEEMSALKCTSYPQEGQDEGKYRGCVFIVQQSLLIPKQQKDHRPTLVHRPLSSDQRRAGCFSRSSALGQKSPRLSDFAPKLTIFAV